MPRKIFEDYPDRPTHRAIRVRLDPIERYAVWNHELYANSPLASLAPGKRPYDGYAIVDLETGRDIGLALRGRHFMRIPVGNGTPESGVETLPRGPRWIPIHASCEAGVSSSSLWHARLEVVELATFKGVAPARRHDPGDQPEGEDLDALDGLETCYA